MNLQNYNLNIMKSIQLITLVAIALISFSCVQQTQPKSITVKVDMNGIENHSKVGIRGSNPLSWNDTTYLTDEDKDGIYEGRFEIYTANYNVEFKFVNHESEFELQDQNNRSLTFEYKPENIIYSATFDSLDDIKIIRN